MTRFDARLEGNVKETVSGNLNFSNPIDNIAVAISVAKPLPKYSNRKVISQFDFGIAFYFSIVQTGSTNKPIFYLVSKHHKP